MAGLSSDLQSALDALRLDTRDSRVLVADFAQWPISLRIKIDVDRVLRRVGTRVAAEVRARIRRGQEAEGRPLPRARTGEGQPLRRTGSLIKSIKYDPRSRAVRPRGFRSDLGASLKGRQEGLLWVLIHTFRHPDLTKIDPMGVDAALASSVRTKMRSALDAELKRPGSGLVAELRRIRPRRR